MTVLKTRSHTSQAAPRKVAKVSRCKTVKKAVDRQMIKVIITTILSKEEEMKGRNMNWLPVNYLTDLVTKFRPAMPFLLLCSTKNVVNYEKRIGYKNSFFQYNTTKKFKSESTTKLTTPSTNVKPIARPTETSHQVSRDSHPTSYSNQ